MPASEHPLGGLVFGLPGVRALRSPTTAFLLRVMATASASFSNLEPVMPCGLQRPRHPFSHSFALPIIPSSCLPWSFCPT